MTNNISRVFKVVRRTSYGLFSATVDSSQRYAHTKYQEGVWVKPKIGKLFAFDSKNAAEAFVKELISARIAKSGSRGQGT